MNFKYEIIKLRNSRFPSCFMIRIKDDKQELDKIISTNQHSIGLVKFTGEKPDNISEFLHAKLCIISVAEIKPNLSWDERENIIANKAELISVGKLGLFGSDDYELILNNKDEKIFLVEINK